jgi:hypothetical protein
MDGLRVERALLRCSPFFLMTKRAGTRVPTANVHAGASGPRQLPFPPKPVKAEFEPEFEWR